MAPTEAFAGIVDFVFPPRCPLCGEGVSRHGGLCSTCWSDLVIPGAPSCRLCQRPFPADLPEGAICAPCMAEPPRHDGVAAGTVYNDTARRLVLAFKNSRRIALAPLLARLIAPRLPGVDRDWLIVPVPLHRWRLWRRGYNQSALLGRELARMTGGTLIVDALQRRRYTPSLAGKGRDARARLLSGAIAVNARQRVRLKGARVLLVDDVLTSGATSNACISVLKRAGAERVVVGCVARVMDEALPHI